jgi:riboflavin synthase alpha subunit
MNDVALELAELNLEMAQLHVDLLALRAKLEEAVTTRRLTVVDDGRVRFDVQLVDQGQERTTLLAMRAGDRQTFVNLTVHETDQDGPPRRPIAAPW